jgi:DNA-binding NarL/FixJ family response regulator
MSELNKFSEAGDTTTGWGIRAATGTLRIAVVESVPLVGYGMKAIVDRDPQLTWVGSRATVASAIELCTSDHPDVVLIGSWVDPHWNLCRLLTGMFRGLLVVALMGEKARTPGAINQARVNGARGLVAADAEIRRLYATIRTVVQRGHYVDPDLGAIADAVDAEEPRMAKPLSKREFEVLQFIADGRTAGYIGKRLGITAATVRTHVSHVLKKLHARDRAHAVARAFEMSLLRPGSEP